MAEEGAYWVSEHVRAYLRVLGFRLPLEDMEGHIVKLDRWMRAVGEFYDYRGRGRPGAGVRGAAQEHHAGHEGVPRVGAASARREGERGVRPALQVLGDLTGLGINYFDFDNVGYVKTATEVSSDNSALMRNIRKHENALQRPISDVSRALLACARGMGEAIPDEGDVRVLLDDSIIQDTEAEKERDMKEVSAGVMLPREYRARWYGESEDVAKRNVATSAARAAS